MLGDGRKVARQGTLEFAKARTKVLQKGKTSKVWKGSTAVEKTI